jgi:hypothetical protein
LRKCWTRLRPEIVQKLLDLSIGVSMWCSRASLRFWGSNGDAYVFCKLGVIVVAE